MLYATISCRLAFTGQNRDFTIELFELQKELAAQTHPVSKAPILLFLLVSW